MSIPARVFPGFRVGARYDRSAKPGRPMGAFFGLSFSFAGKEKEGVFSRTFIGWTLYRPGYSLAPTSEGGRAQGAGGLRGLLAPRRRGHKKRAGGLSSLDFLPALSFKVAATYSPTCAVPSA